MITNTLYRISENILAICDDHLLIDYVAQGTLDQIDENVTFNGRTAWLIHQDSSLEEGAVFHNFNLILLDVELPDRSNADQIQSDMLQVGIDIVGKLNQVPINKAWIDLTNVTMTPFEERFNDYVAGVTVAFSVKALENFDVCSDTFAGSYIPTSNGQFILQPTQYLTCTTLQDCPAFIAVSQSAGGGNFVPYQGATGNVNLGSFALTGSALQLSGATTGGKLTWNDTDGSANLTLKGGNVSVDLGQKQVARVVNGAGTNLLGANYQVVKVTGAQGQRLQVVLAQANNDLNSATTLGLVAENINNNQEGFIVTSGPITEIDTTGDLQGETWNDGDVLYLSPTTPGALTNIKPQAPQHTVIVGFVEYKQKNHGKIFVKIDNGYELDELHNVRINTASLAPGDLLVRAVNNGGVWVNSKQLTGSYAITGSLTATSITGSLQVASLPKVSRPVIRLTTPASSGNSTLEQNITSISIPANTLSVGDMIRVGAMYSFSGGSTKTPRVRFGLGVTSGTNILYGPSTLASSIASNTLELIGIVTSTTNLRIGAGISTNSGLGIGTNATINYTIDTASTVSFSFNVQKTTGTDTAILEFAWVEILTA